MNQPVRYRVRHETVYRYGGDVAHSHQLLHLTPRDAPQQTCLERLISVTPQPSTRREDLDAFGNHVTRLEYDQPHDRLEVLAEVAVEVRPPMAVGPAASHAWETVQRSLTFSGAPIDPLRLDACRFRTESSYVRIKQTFSDYGADCFTPERPILEASEALSAKIHRDFKYVPGSTNIRTSAVEAFAARRGVCQDFAHVMLGALRSRGLAARYVSGYLRTLPPPGADAAYVGADASHAWVSVFCPPFGWVDLDPTNDVRVGADHIVIAWGRDFGDVSPLRGVIVGGAGTAYRYACRCRQSKICPQENQRRIELAKPNYRHAKKQKEAARKARQDAKQQRRANATETPDGETEAVSETVAMAETTQPGSAELGIKPAM